MKRPVVVNLSGDQLQIFLDEKRKPYLLKELDDRYGPVFQLKFGPAPLGIVVTDGELIMVAQKTIERGPFMQKGAAALMGKSVLTMDPGPEHRRVRKPLTAAFSHATLADYSQRLLVEVNDSLLVWSEKEEINILEETSQLARNFLFRTIFRSSLMSVTDQRLFVDLFNLFAESPLLRTVLPEWLHWTIVHDAQFQDLKLRGYEIIRKIVEERRAGNDDTPDMVGLLLAEAESGAFTEQEVLENLMTMFVAGYETTANALAWIINTLGRDKLIARALRAEVRQVLDQEEFGLRTINKLPLVEHFRQEILRKYNPSWQAFGWTGNSDFVLGDWILPKKNLVFLITYFAFNNPKKWDRPEELILDRQYPKWFNPFSSGERICIGKPLAELDIAMTVAYAAKDYEFEAYGDTEPYFNGTMQAPAGMKAKVRRM